MSHIVDLSLPLDRGVRGFDYEISHVFGKQWWNARVLHLYSHSGTHVDAPFHYEAGMQTVDQIPLEKCVCPAHVVDCSGVGPSELIFPHHLGRVANEIQPGEGLLIRTDWHRRVQEPSYRDELPRISPGLADWCVQAELSILGVEQPAVAAVHDQKELTSIHQRLLGAGIVILEGLAYLDQLRQSKVTLIALPLRIVGGDGSPVRAIAIED